MNKHLYENKCMYVGSYLIVMYVCNVCMYGSSY